MTEFGFIETIRTLCADLPLGGFEGIGDDCAVLPLGNGESLVFTTDLLTEGVHFLRGATSPEELGGKALAVNLSDVAAMGACPVATLLSLSLPADATDDWAARFMQGYHALSARCGAALVGGDTTRSQTGITINVTAIGRAKDAHLKRRSAARPGDILLVTDPLGASGAGLRDILAGNFGTPLAALHRNPLPQVEEGQWLGMRPEVHAMMDLSDGLASDVRRIMEQSGVGTAIELAQIPVAEGSDLRTAACGGEDYKLLLTAAPEAAERLATDFRKRFGRTLYPIGRIEAGDGLRWLDRGTETQLDWQGFTHY
ncbi:MAG: thiamine-phosphate kinase [Alistipes sp.]|nr:thiamine-phosphate kinase [Alistipes sp.]